MIAWWALVGCQFQVDFDPDQTGSTADTGPPRLGPALVTTTHCSSKPEPWVYEVDSTLTGGPVTGATTVLHGVALERIEFLVATGGIEIRVGAVSAPQIDTTLAADATLWFEVAAGTLTLTGLCKTGGACSAPSTVITLPEPVDTVVGQSGIGPVVVTDAARRDVVITSLTGDITVTGDTAGILAKTLEGDVTLDAPRGQVIDLSAPSGRIEFAGSATTELCAVTGLGPLDTTVQRADVVYLQSSAADVTAAFATRVRRTHVHNVSGATRLEVPAGAYDIQYAVLPSGGVTLDGVTDDPRSPDRISGSSVTGTVEIVGT